MSERIHCDQCAKTEKRLTSGEPPYPWFRVHSTKSVFNPRADLCSLACLVAYAVAIEKQERERWADLMADVS